MVFNPDSTSRDDIGGLSRQYFLALVSGFWLYVALSNVLFAYGMSTGIAQTTDVPVFAPWNVRVLQHILLLPCLLVSFWASLRLQWRPLWVAIPLQLLLAVSFAAIAYPAMMVGHWLLAAGNQSSAGADGSFLSMWLASFVSVLPAYGFGLALVTGIALNTRFQRSELRIAALEREWSTARLTALRMQLSPHTLFNLLHTIRGHIEWDPKAAQSMVVQLADLLRRLLNAGERDFSRLAEELQFVRSYLELQQRRFADRLTIVLPESTDLADVLVPSLILQPLVENAVVHGLAGHHGPVVVRVAVSGGPGVVILSVANTVAEHPPGGSTGVGIGIGNVKERLAVQFEGRATLESTRQDGMWVSEIKLPASRA